MSVTLDDRLDGIEARLARIEVLLNAEPAAKAAPGADLVWKNGWRPRFWHDAEVRAEVIARYRSATLDDATAQLAEKFGARAPSRSAIHRVWKLIDKRRAA